MMRIIRTMAAAALVTSCMVATVAAQRNGRRHMQVQMQTLQGEGTVQRVRPRLLQVAMQGNENWLIALPNDYRKFIYEATATPRWLRPRMPVQFNAHVTLERRKREVVLQEPVEALTVAPFQPGVGMGIFPDPSMDQRDGLFTNDDEKQKKRRSHKNESIDGSCLIVGQLVEIKDGKLRIAAGGVTVRCELAPKADISVQWHDAQWVRPGDKAQITARYLPGRTGQAQGVQISINAEKTLDIEEKPARGKKGKESGKQE